MVGRLHLLGLVLLASAASVTAQCPIDEEPAGDIELELTALADPACRAQADMILVRIEASLAMGLESEEMDSEGVAEIRQLLELHRIRGLLVRRDVQLAREAIERMLTGIDDGFRGGARRARKTASHARGDFGGTGLDSQPRQLWNAGPGIFDLCRTQALRR